MFHLGKHFIHGKRRHHDDNFVLRLQICAAKEINGLVRAIGEQKLLWGDAQKIRYQLFSGLASRILR
jgi:hypothetical protein